MSALDKPCEGFRELSLLPDSALGSAERAHLASCAECRAKWEDLQELRELGSSLPWDAPDADRSEQVRTRLLTRALDKPSRMGRKRRSLWLLVAAIPLCIVVYVALSAQRAPTLGAPTAAIHASPDASYSDFSTGMDRIVRLSDGMITVEVDKLTGGQRFRVITANAEVEVRGTVFDVGAKADHIRSVRVLHGRVEVRVQGNPTRVLEAGERWEAPAPTPATSPTTTSD